MPIYLPQDYKNRRHLRKEWGRAKTGQVSPQGTVEDWERWDGSRDAVVKPAAFAMKITALPKSEMFLRCVLELEKAIREHERALKSRDLEWRKRTTRKVEIAKRRVLEQQGG